MALSELEDHAARELTLRDINLRDLVASKETYPEQDRADLLRLRRLLEMNPDD